MTELEVELRRREAEAWRLGEASGWSRAMRMMSDEPKVQRAVNPFEDVPDVPQVAQTGSQHD